MPDNRRCIVVGAGLLGLSSAWALSRRGWDVSVLEAAGTPGHERSGSKGDARIFRLGYPEPHYVEMAVLARSRWRDLEAATGSQLLHVTGQVTLGDDTTRHAIATALAAAGAPVEEISATAAAQLFPGIAAPGPVLVEPDSGVLAADACLRAFRQAGDFDLRTGCVVTALGQSPGSVSIHTADGVTLQSDIVVVCAGPVLVQPDSGVLAADACLRAFRQAGDFDLRTGFVVTALGQSPGSVSIHTADGVTLQSDIVVVCAGPASLGLLPVAPTTGTTSSLPQVAYFAPRTPDVVPPIFIEWGDDMLYGLPIPDGGPHAGTYKVSRHTPGPPLQAFDPADPVPLAGDDPALLAQLTDAVSRLLPSLAPQPVATERCVYDNSADTDFVLDRMGRIVVGCGTSGHAFKFGPLLGELLADLAEDRRPAVDLGRFGLRPGLSNDDGPSRASL